jgi:hypothetical protein
MNDKTPKDVAGNELVPGMLVAYDPPGFLFFKVIAVENGGVHTPSGVTPAVVRLVCDITLRQLPGVPFLKLLTPVMPSQQKILEDMTGLPKV